jgi:DNA-binding transcriptional ArsR family regulator
MIYGTPAPDLDGILSKASQDRRHQQRERRTGEYLRGPVPLTWLSAAKRCGLLALTVGLLLWFRKGCTRSTDGLTVSERQYREFGLSRQTFAVGLSRLESAGLVTVERKAGRKSRITLCTAGNA